MSQKIGIFKYSRFLPKISKKYWSSLNEGATQLIKKEDIFLKLEYANPTGSVKDRGCAIQFSFLKKLGIKNTVISSSGNAAISAAFYSQLIDASLIIFTSLNINPQKEKILKNFGLNIIKTARPVSASIKFAQKNNYYHLRQSTDPYAVYGYVTLALEICAELPAVDAIFFPVSSGTTLVGCSIGFKRLGILPAFHVVQTAAVHPIASVFDNNFQPVKRSLADGLVAKYTPRKDEVIKIVKKTKGWGWIVSDKQIEKANQWLLKQGITCGYEAAAAIAGYWKAKARGFHYQNPVCLLTGKYYATGK